MDQLQTLLILTVHKFISLKNIALPLLSYSTIKKFSLNFMLRCDDGVSYFPVIDKWIEFVVNKKVEDLRLNICYRIVYLTGIKTNPITCQKFSAVVYPL